MTIICDAVTQVSQWYRVSADNLAAAIVRPAALRSMSLMDLFVRATASGATVSEFVAIWQYAEFVQRVETALTNGDLAGAQALLAVCPVAFSAPTLTALGLVLATNTLRFVDVVAAENGETAPQEVAAEDVTAALTAAGYAWDGEIWQRAA